MDETKVRCVCHFSSPCPRTVGGLLSIPVDGEKTKSEQESAESTCFFDLTEKTYSE